MWQGVALVLSCVACGISSVSRAADLISATNHFPAPGPLPDVTFPLLRIAFALGFVLVLFFVVAWLVKNWQGFAGMRGQPSRLRIHEMRSLGNRQALFVVGYDQQRLLIASSPTGVTLIERLPQAAPGEDAQSGPAPSNFAEALRRILPNR